MSPTLAPDLLELLANEAEVDIETSAGGGPVRRTTIWIVISRGAAYVASYRGPRGRWYRELLAAGGGALHVGGRRVAVRAVPAAETAS